MVSRNSSTHREARSLKLLAMKVKVRHAFNIAGKKAVQMLTETINNTLQLLHKLTN